MSSSAPGIRRLLDKPEASNLSFFHDMMNGRLRILHSSREICLQGRDDSMTGNGLTGWLTPEGEFLVCEYGKHQEVANIIVKEGKMYADKLRAIQSDKHPLLQFNDVFLKRSKSYIAIGVQPGGKNSFLELPIDHMTKEVRITREQIRWFHEKYNELTAEQQKILIAWVEGFKPIEETNSTKDSLEKSRDIG